MLAGVVEVQDTDAVGVGDRRDPIPDPFRPVGQKDDAHPAGITAAGPHLPPDAPEELVGMLDAGHVAAVPAASFLPSLVPTDLRDGRDLRVAETYLVCRFPTGSCTLPKLLSDLRRVDGHRHRTLDEPLRRNPLLLLEDLPDLLLPLGLQPRTQLVVHVQRLPHRYQIPPLGSEDLVKPPQALPVRIPPRERCQEVLHRRGVLLLDP